MNREHLDKDPEDVQTKSPRNMLVFGQPGAGKQSLFYRVRLQATPWKCRIDFRAFELS